MRRQGNGFLARLFGEKAVVHREKVPHVLYLVLLHGDAKSPVVAALYPVTRGIEGVAFRLFLDGDATSGPRVKTPRSHGEEWLARCVLALLPIEGDVLAQAR